MVLPTLAIDKRGLSEARSGDEISNAGEYAPMASTSRNSLATLDLDSLDQSRVVDKPEGFAHYSPIPLGE
jgi:hypothetical protein